MSLAGRINRLVIDALQKVAGEDGLAPMTAPAKDEKFGDYQCNAAMALAKKLGRKPRDLAADIAENLEKNGQDLFASIEVVGPGFINMRLTDEALRQSFAEAAGSAPKSRVVIDYSCPNIAKQMHVGHLRSTIIGDAISRILEYRGYEVIRQNHVGDWGTQFGLLCAWLMDRGISRDDIDLSDLEALYRESQALANEDEGFKERSRQRVVALHTGDKETLDTWRHIVGKSLEHIDKVYRKLGVKLTKDDIRGESFYNPFLPGVVDELMRRFPAGSRPMEVVEDQGAICVFLYEENGEPAFKNPDGGRLPLIIRKSDGAFLYPTTDLAALRYRINELKADRIIYATDARQAQHFKMFFRAAREAGWAGEVILEHVPFGSVLGPDNKPLKTRAGENVKLADLLDEACERALAAIKERGSFTEEEAAGIANAVGIGAVKYADLSQNRVSDYVFSFDKMLAMEGNTAPYLMYAYARIRSIRRKAGAEAGTLSWQEPEERRLVLHLARFEETIDQVMDGWRINLLCEYLYSLAGLFMKFYENCPVLNASSDAIRGSRLALCDLAAKTLRTGLDLLGINAVERM